MPDRTPDPNVLERILSLQSGMHAAPTETALGELACRALCELPGVSAAALCADGEIVFASPRETREFSELIRRCRERAQASAPAPEICGEWPKGEGGRVMCISLRAAGQRLGGLLLRRSSLEHFDRYRTCIESTANLVALIVHGRRREAEIRRLSEELARLPRRRTREPAPAANHRGRTEEQLRRERDTAQRYLDVAGVILVALNQRGEVTRINRKGCEILGCAEAEILGTNWFERFLPQRLRKGVSQVFQQLMAGAVEPAERYENPVVTRRGEERLIAWHNTILRDRENRIVGTLSSGEDITERKRAEEMLRFTQFAVDRAADAAFWMGPDARFLYVNEAACRSLGYTREELLKLTVHDIDPDFPPQVWSDHWQELRRRRSFTATSHHRTKDGRLFPVELLVNFVEFEGRQYNCAFARDISERVRAEEDRQRLEAQLRHAQKMEAVGQLAGGVAHDFNNILTAIIGNAELSLHRLSDTTSADDPLVQGLKAVERAAQRAASLTRQLLLFSRRDVAMPELIDLNQTLREMEQMLGRLISENIRLDLLLEPGLCCVRADAGQIEQVIMNLVVNARDAMQDGGKLTIETANVVLDAGYVHAHAESHVGPHVLLTVSDTGCGMDPGTAERIFEPFFTTKPAGQGTGLGLATVYAIVKQAEGHVTVYSEPQRGSTFRVYLPAVQTSAEQPRGASTEESPPTGTETVLLCEDDEPVRHLAGHLLKDAGYTVLAAETGAQALQRAAAHHGPIHLLVTDVVMPEIDGRKLTDMLTAAKPDLRVLLISGYTANIIVHHGVLDEGVAFLEKPFSRRTFLKRVREVLDKPSIARP